MTLALDAFPQDDSFLQRFDPRWKLAGFVLAGGVVVLLHTLPTAVAAFALSVSLVPLARMPLGWYARRLVPVTLFLTVFAFFMTFVVGRPDQSQLWGPVHVSLGGILLGLQISARALALFTLMLVLLASAPLDATLKAAHSLYLPGLIVQLAVMTYRFIFVLALELTRMRVAVRVRGYRNRMNRHSYRTIGHVAGTLLVRGYERGERVGQAMRCRGFAGKYHSLTECQTTAKDVAAFCLLVAGAALLLVWDWFLR